MAVFDFGRNWQAFSNDKMDAQRLQRAQESLQALLQQHDLEGASLLDVGCGSGLFSIAARTIGAQRVVGVDINPRCIEVATDNVARLAVRDGLSFCVASALDQGSLAPLGRFDIVYAWGSLHHTGALWNAIRTVAQSVAPGGTLVLAIYNKHVTSRAWLAIKRVYNHLPRFGQRLMALALAPIIYLAKLAVTRRNPFDKQRGMDFWYDVIDWVGGYPYEYATPAEVEVFMRGQGFTLRRVIPSEVPTGCNEFVFVRNAAA